MIKRLRRERGMTQEDLARVLNVHQTAVSQWETGRTCPDMQTIQSIADYFGTTTDAIFGRGSENDPGVSNNELADDDDFWELREQLRNNPGMRMLFSASKNATTDDLIRAAKIIEALKEESHVD